jgi:hypothetical protein
VKGVGNGEWKILVDWQAPPYKRLRPLQRRGRIGPEPPNTADTTAETRVMMVIGSIIFAETCTTKVGSF